MTTVEDLRTRVDEALREMPPGIVALAQSLRRPVIENVGIDFLDDAGNIVESIPPSRVLVFGLPRATTTEPLPVPEPPLPSPFVMERMADWCQNYFERRKPKTRHYDWSLDGF